MNLRFDMRIPLLLAGLAAGAILGELALRVASLVHPAFMQQFHLELNTTIYSAHPYLNHTLTPNLNLQRQGVPEWEMPTYELRTNKLGFRFEPKFFLPKQRTAYRIAALGDSQIEGYRLEATLPFLLEKRLAPIVAQKRIEVMNFGVLSFSPIIHYVNLKRTVLGFRPDLVILHVDMTDVFDDNVRYREITEWDKEGNPSAVRPGVEYSTINADGRSESTMLTGRRMAMERPWSSLDALTIWCVETSYLVRVVYYKLHTAEEVFHLYDGQYLKAHERELDRVKKIDLAQIHGWCRNYNDPAVQRQIGFTFSILERIRLLLIKEGIPLVIITLPIKEQLVPVKGNPVLPKKPIEALQDYCRKKGIGFHSPLSELSDALKQGVEVYNRDNMHLIEKGQAIWADSLAAYLAPLIRKQRDGGEH